MLTRLISEQMAKDGKEFNLFIDKQMTTDLLNDEVINHLDLEKTIICDNKKYIVLKVSHYGVLTQIDSYSDISPNKNYLMENKNTDHIIAYRGILRKKGFSSTDVFDSLRVLVEEHNLDRVFDIQEFINTVNSINIPLPIVIKQGDFYWKFENNNTGWLYGPGRCFGEDIEDISLSQCFLFEHIPPTNNEFHLNEFPFVYHEETMIVK